MLHRVPVGVGVIDTHCHLDIIQSQGIPESTSIQNARAAGVQAVVQIATDIVSTRRNLERAIDREHEDWRVYWTAGLHPEAANDLAHLDEIFVIAKQCRDRPDFFGLGETGLDYFHTTEFEANQKESLARHIDLADQLRLPLVIHTRDDRAYSPEKTRSVFDTYDMIKDRSVRGVLHCFTYTDKEALPFVDLGWFVSYSGVLTFKNAKAVQSGAIALPLEALLVETDAPFLAPIPNRGKTNEPAYVVHTLDFLANLRARHCGEDPEHVRATILENSQRFLNLKNEL